MTRKSHPADIRDAAIIRNAVRFDIALFLGIGRYAQASTPTLAEARIEAMRLASEYLDNVRKPMIYAIDAAERAALVTDNHQP
jgi:hypothetical protein